MLDRVPGGVAVEIPGAGARLRGTGLPRRTRSSADHTRPPAGILDAGIDLPPAETWFITVATASMPPGFAAGANRRNRAEPGLAAGPQGRPYSAVSCRGWYGTAGPE